MLWESCKFIHMKTNFFYKEIIPVWKKSIKRCTWMCVIITKMLFAWCIAIFIWYPNLLFYILHTVWFWIQISNKLMSIFNYTILLCLIFKYFNKQMFSLLLLPLCRSFSVNTCIYKVLLLLPTKHRYFIKNFTRFF